MNNSVDYVRQRLDEVLSKGGYSPSLLAEDGLDALVHELSVFHQELEYQNEELRRIQEELEISRQYYKELFENAPINYVLYDRDLVIEGANQFCRDTLKVFPQLLAGRNLAAYIHPDFQDAFYLHLRRLPLEGKSEPCTITMVCEDGTLLRVKMVSNVVEYRNKTVIRSAFLDISNEYAQQEKIELLTFRDSLTGLYNRLYFEQMLDSFLGSDALPVGYVMGDVNALKLTNDTFGHEDGDSLLCAAAEVLKQQAPKRSLLVRLGGDEFVCVIPRTEESELAGLIQRLEAHCSEVSVGAVQLSISFGYSLYTGSPDTPSRALGDAEDMMYQNKLFTGRHIREKLVRGIVKSLFSAHPREQEHALKVRMVCKQLLEIFHIHNKDARNLLTAAFLHDIGKVVLDADLLRQNKAMTDVQVDIYRRHPEKGYRILSSLDDAHTIALAVLHHHERWDGKGYPMGLAGEHIPLHARIISLADAVVWFQKEHPTDGYDGLMTYLDSEASTILDPSLVSFLRDSEHWYETLGI